VKLFQTNNIEIVRACQDYFGFVLYWPNEFKQEAQLMLTTGSTRLAVSWGQQTWYHSTCYI